jgi:formyltetrahydrofolate synthetase
MTSYYDVGLDERPIPSSPRPSDLNPLDLFILRYVKEHVYILQLPRTVKELKERISETIESMNGDKLRVIWQEFEYSWMFAVLLGVHIYGNLQVLIYNLQHLV